LNFKKIHAVFVAGHLVASVLFVACAIALVVLAMMDLWQAVNPTNPVTIAVRVNTVLETIALLTVSVASFELGQTIMEEEVQRDVPMSIPTRVRRFPSRFMIVLVVSLSIKSLVAVFQFVHEEPSDLLYAAAIGLVPAALMAAWGVFIKLNRSAEELEPEAIQWVKQEDEKVE